MTRTAIVDALNAYDADTPGDSWRNLSPEQLADYLVGWVAA